MNDKNKALLLPILMATAFTENEKMLYSDILDNTKYVPQVERKTNLNNKQKRSRKKNAAAKQARKRNRR